MDDANYPDWQRFEPYVNELASRLTADPHDQDDTKQEMWLCLFTELHRHPARADDALKSDMRYAAMRFLNRVCHDGPHSKAGIRDTSRMIPLDEANPK